MISGLENPLHWLILLGIALLVLGPKRLPEAGRSLGRGIREFKESLSGGGSEPAPQQVETPPPAGPADPV